MLTATSPSEADEGTPTNQIMSTSTPPEQPLDALGLGPEEFDMEVPPNNTTDSSVPPFCNYPVIVPPPPLPVIRCLLCGCKLPSKLNDFVDTEEDRLAGLSFATGTLFQLSKESVEDMEKTFGKMEQWDFSFCGTCWPAIQRGREVTKQLEDLATPLAKMRVEVVEKFTKTGRRLVNSNCTATSEAALIKEELCRMVCTEGSGTDRSDGEGSLQDSEDEIGMEGRAEPLASDDEEEEDENDFDGLGTVIIPDKECAIPSYPYEQEHPDNSNTGSGGDGVRVKEEPEDFCNFELGLEEAMIFPLTGEDDEGEGGLGEESEEEGEGDDEEDSDDDFVLPQIEKTPRRSRGRKRRRKMTTRIPYKRQRQRVENAELTARNTPRVYQFRCPDTDCLQYFPTEYFRDAHYRRKHLGIHLCFVCGKCGKGFKRSYDLTVHSNSCGLRPPRKPKPNDPTQWSSLMSGNGANGDETDLEKFSVDCTICGKIFQTRKRLAIHMNSKHEGPKKYTYACSACNQGFETKDTLETHILSHIEGLSDFPCKCALCDKMYAFGQQLEAHINEDHRCPHCPAIIKAAHNRSLHIRFVHEKQLDYACEFCDKSFPLSAELACHMVFKHHEQLGVEPFKCKECGKEYERWHRLKTHNVEVHNIELPKLPCDQCHRSFYHSGILDLHKRLHSKIVLEVVCEICGSRLKSKQKLRTHIKNKHTHEGKKMCETCGKLYTKHGLETHTCRGVDETNMRNAKRAIMCDECGRQFVGKNAMAQHKKRGHTSKDANAVGQSSPVKRSRVYTCSICTLSFAGFKTRQKHIRDVHNIEPPPLRRRRKSNKQQTSSFEVESEIKLPFEAAGTPVGVGTIYNVGGGNELSRSVLLTAGPMAPVLPGSSTLGPRPPQTTVQNVQEYYTNPNYVRVPYYY